MPFAFGKKTATTSGKPYTHQTTSEATLVDHTLPENTKPEIRSRDLTSKSSGKDKVDHRRNWEALAFAAMTR
ncbi:hypothetical protein JDV02_005399 [Purpureocillium takamizusanense]|uniref:Uncharacterized protein n=1 Tax=Purpureocillium takamizusanense TaxID=2060973 RepID=A0A9Q8QH79_9HYPO|nr:uncharacterized protein JDV02_005399 [Purpureocillium takamizusanense]UNI19197.1 hypothetical protein JDV02_005399 [Purpureocillium takamizusanense]